MHKPTLRVLQVLELLCSQEGPMTLSELSRHMEVPKSTLLPILQTMTHHRYISRDDAQRYSPGPALIGAGAAAEAVYSPGEEIRRCLQKMVDQFGETCYYGIREGSQVLYLEKIDSPQPLRMLTSIGHRMPAYATGIGKALLMDMTPQQLRQLFVEPLPPLTEHTVKNLDTLSRQLEQARSLGYCWEVEESTEHIRCFGAPVRRNGEIVGAVSIAIPIFRYEEAKKEEIIQALLRTAADISIIAVKERETCVSK